MSLTVTVHGTPAPQGSKRHVGNGVMVESSAKVKPWREAVKWAVLQAVLDADRWNVRQSYAGRWEIIRRPIEGPISVDLVFTVAKPASAPKRTRTWPAKRPDLDKLIRSTLDAITDSGAIRDDAQIVELTAAKRYPGEGLFALPVPGAWIRITEVSE